jgi:hypothetical protein
MRVICYRNEAPGHFDGYTEGADLVRYEADPTPFIEDTAHDVAVLNRTFRVMNAVDGWEPILETRERSLSVGDVVEIQRPLGGGSTLVLRYAVADCGFERIEVS